MHSRRLNARDLAARRIAEQIHVWPNLDLAPLRTEGLDPRDARLAQAIYAETLRRWLTLETLLDARLARPLRELEPKLQAALLVGACQLFFFDHLPDHAVVDEAVSWAARRIRPRAGGLLNAVLRRMIDLRGPILGLTATAETAADRLPALPLSDGRHRAVDPSVIPDDRIERLTFQTSHPPDLLRRWSQRYAPTEVERLALHNLVQAPTIVHGLAPSAIADHAEVEPHDEPGFAVWSGDHAGLVTLLNLNPGSRVQDPASFEAIHTCAPTLGSLVGALVVDGCAGSGTKTEQLALTFPGARILATDVDRRRFDLLSERFRDHPCVEIVEPGRLVEFAGEALLVLLDVPCSNTGTLARRIEAKYRMDDAALRSLVDVQRQILADSLRLKAPNGRVLYSTCSLEPEENEKQIEWVRKWHALRLLAEGRRMPRGLPGESPARYADGSYFALLG